MSSPSLSEEDSVVSFSDVIVFEGNKRAPPFCTHTRIISFVSEALKGSFGSKNPEVGEVTSLIKA